MIINNRFVLGVLNCEKLFPLETTAIGIFLYLAPEANDYDSLADIGFSRFLQN